MYRYMYSMSTRMFLMCPPCSNEREEKSGKHKSPASTTATRGTPTAGPLETVTKETKASGRSSAASKKGAAVASNGGLPSDYRVS